jgi:disulfide bond formation protein DsbB
VAAAELPVAVIRWGFIAFLLVVVVMLFIVIPSRDASLEVTWITAPGLVVLGLVTGILSGLLGVGGGIIVVPALILLFGTSDLIAKGTSLLMMIPTAISGTIGNLRRSNVDLPAAALIGVAACTTTALGPGSRHSSIRSRPTSSSQCSSSSSRRRWRCAPSAHVAPTGEACAGSVGSERVCEPRAGRPCLRADGALPRRTRKGA